MVMLKIAYFLVVLDLLIFVPYFLFFVRYILSVFFKGKKCN